MKNSDSLTSCIAEARSNGYTEVFRIKDRYLVGADGVTRYDPKNVVIEDFQPVFYEADPAKRSIIYLIQTATNTKGIILDLPDAPAEERFSNLLSQSAPE